MPDVPSNLTALVAELTLEEKASLVIGSAFWYTTPVERLGVPRIMVSDGPHGLRTQLHEADHLGLSTSVPATCFPTASALGSSWNADLFRRVGEALGREAAAIGVSVVLGPGINMKRSPLCGRNFEYVSEDPRHAGELATAMVRGIQSQGVGTSVKHYAANNQEDDRLRVSAEVDERTVREIYLPAFERVVKNAQPWTVMCAYNKLNGTYCSEHHWLLTEVLRDEWGFDGLVVSDWGAVHDRVAALRGGLDLEMPPNLGVSDAAVAAAVRSGELDESVLDESVGRVLRLVERSQPALAKRASFDTGEHHALARRAALESAVLLKNDGGVLPLQPAPGSRIAVIGEFARTPRYQGAGSSQVNPTQLDVPFDELRAGVGDQVQVDFAAGFGVGTTESDAELAREAVELASGATDVVVFLGLPSDYESEGFDRMHMDLPTNQVQLIEALAEVHDRLIVVLANGSAVRLSNWQDKVSAILECWLSGQAAGGGSDGPAVGRGQSVRQARRDHSRSAGGQPVLLELPRRLPDRPLRRVHLHRLPRVRPAGPGGQLPVRLRSFVHDVRDLQALCRRQRGGAGWRSCGDGGSLGHQYRGRSRCRGRPDLRPGRGELGGPADTRTEGLRQGRPGARREPAGDRPLG